MNKLKIFLALMGWLTLTALVIVAALSLKHPQIVDGILWRYEILENNPTVSQRIFEKRSHIQSTWEDKTIAKGAVILLGDSHLRLLPKSNVPNLYNFAIGGQTIARMTPRIEQFASLRDAALVIVNGGENDLNEDRPTSEVLKRWEDFLKKLRSATTSPILCIGLPETKLDRLYKDTVGPVNTGITQLCGKYGAEFLPLNLNQGIFEKVDLSSDKMHLSISAMQVLAAEIDRRAIKARVKMSMEN